MNKRRVPKKNQNVNFFQIGVEPPPRPPQNVNFLTDMENVRNFTRAGLFVYRFYPKVRELRQFCNCNKTAKFKCKYNVYNIYIFTSCLFNNYKKS